MPEHIEGSHAQAKRAERKEEGKHAQRTEHDKLEGEPTGGETAVKTCVRPRAKQLWADI